MKMRATTVNITENLKPFESERLTDFIYDSSPDEDDKPWETESKCSPAIMDQNTSSIKSNKVMIIHLKVPVLSYIGTYSSFAL